MVAHSGATVRADRLRPLSVPRPIRVKADERGRPVAVYLKGASRKVPDGARPHPTGARGQGTGDRGMGDALTLTLSQRERGYPRPLAPDPRPLLRGWVSVIDVLDRWRIDDEWWRQEISRMYFRVALAEGRTEDSGLRTEREGVPQSSALSPQSFVRPQSSYLLMIFHDLVGGGWYVQEAAQRGGRGSGVGGRSGI